MMSFYCEGNPSDVIDPIRQQGGCVVVWGRFNGVLCGYEPYGKNFALHVPSRTLAKMIIEKSDGVTGLKGKALALANRPIMMTDEGDVEVQLPGISGGQKPDEVGEGVTALTKGKDGKIEETASAEVVAIKSG